MSFANTEILSLALARWIRPLTGREPYNKKNVDDAEKATLKAVGVLEQHFLVNTFLVGERITLADLFVAGIVSCGFRNVFDKKWRSEHPNVTRWYETVYHQPIYSAVVPKLEFIDEAIKYEPPKKEKAPKKEEKTKEAPKPKAKEVDDDEEEEEDKPAPKPKHPLEELGKPTWNLDDWKRQYSNCNKQYRTVMPWFWENYNPEEYSIWQLEYRYPEELEMTFQSSNAISRKSLILISIKHLLTSLLDGIHQRLDASRKYLFGQSGVFGEDRNNFIRGAYIVRGQEAEPAFNVAPEYESFKTTRLDVSKPDVKAFVEDVWSEDKDIVNIDGKDVTYAACPKAFK